jgi:hypothetical protein
MVVEKRGGTTMKLGDGVNEPCPYCGRRPPRNKRPFVKRGYFADGSDFVGHRSCYLEMRSPEDPTLGHQRHDIKEGR